MNIEWSFSEGGNSAKCQQNINSYRRKCMALERTDTVAGNPNTSYKVDCVVLL